MDGLGFDHQGRLWADSDKGVHLLDHGQWRRLTAEDGLVWDDTNSLAFEAASDGSVWIGTSGGLSRYVPLPHAVPDQPPAVVVNVAYDGKRTWQPDQHPLLPYRNRAITIQYSALEFDIRIRSKPFRDFAFGIAQWDQRARQCHERVMLLPLASSGSYPGSCSGLVQMATPLNSESSLGRSIV